MFAPTCKSFLLSSALNITEEAMDVKKQGIVSILGSDTERPNKATSLRRTLSADMSSQKWLTQQGLMSPPLKRSPSSMNFPVSSSFEEGEEVENRGQFDIWSSIISQKADEAALKSSSPPYIHPLVKRSASCLSEKSLEICTESLGSETGSDGFSSETSEPEEDHQEMQLQNKETVSQMPCFDGEKVKTLKHNYDVGKKSVNSSLPPPIPSLSGKDGASRRLKTHRDNGRLVIEAVSMPSLNNFLAQRQDGRLVLTFANTISEVEEEIESFGDEEKGTDIDMIDYDEEEEEEEEEEERCCEMEQAPKLSSGAMNVHRLAVMMNKPIWLANRKPTWPKTFDEIVNFGENWEGKVEPKTPPPQAQSLPPRPPVTRLIPPPPSKVVASAGDEGGAASFNAYEYYWRRPNQVMSKANKDQKHLQVLEGKKSDDYFVPLLKGCKEPRRSLLFWEPYCIAT